MVKKFFKNWDIKKHILFGLVLSSILALILLEMRSNKIAATIGIIGSADGPTSIFVSSRLLRLDIIAISSVALFIIFMLLYRLIKRQSAGNKQHE